MQHSSPPQLSSAVRVLVLKPELTRHWDKLKTSMDPLHTSAKHLQHKALYRAQVKKQAKGRR